jgi:hypothetical protein
VESQLDHFPVPQQPRPLSSVGSIVPFPTPPEFVRRLAQEIADAANADQFAVAVDGIAGTGGLELVDRVPRQWLEYMNGGRPAVYRLTVPLRSGDRELGLVRLSTSDPAGFNPIQIARARAAANRAADRLGTMLSRAANRRGERRGRCSNKKSTSEPIMLDRYRATNLAR